MCSPEYRVDRPARECGRELVTVPGTVTNTEILTPRVDLYAAQAYLRREALDKDGKILDTKI